MNNSTDEFGCCSIVLQLDGNNSILSYRRDSNYTADIHIENIIWHGIPVIKQYKTDGGYFNHVIITNNGWIIGMGGIDDGADNAKCENISYQMISKDGSISKKALEKIQKINEPYGRGHMIIKAPNGNYGFATVDKVKTGKLEPGEYISLPNNYSLSRSGNLSLNTSDKILSMNELSQLDKYGFDRREIITYDINSTPNNNTTNIYVSNEDGRYLDVNYTGCIDDVYFNNTLTEASAIPVAPNYKHIGSISFIAQNNDFLNLLTLAAIILFTVFVAVLFFVVLKLVRFIKFKILR